MKWLVIPTQAFSPGIKAKEVLSFDDFPWPIKLYLKFFKNKVFIIHDEISFLKCNVPMAEKKKSSRSRLIKLLEQYSEARCGLTGTLLSKSPVNIIDPYRFLSASFFAGETPWDIAEQYSIMMSLRTVRGRVMISQKEWTRQRKRMINAYRAGGEGSLDYAKGKISKELNISEEDCEHILVNRKYNPFKNIDQLMKRMESVTMTIKREDIFDISYDKFVYNPIKRPVQLGEKAKRLGNELVKLGFTDNITLGKAQALELQLRLQDICNGFDPIGNVDSCGKRTIYYEALPENPKLDALMELLDEIDTDKNQVAIMCSRVNAFRSIKERLDKAGIINAMYTGDQNAKEKHEAESMANNGNARVFSANPASAAFGLNCLKKFNYLIWYCVNNSVEQYHQAQHRLLRGQSLNPKYAYQLYVKGSVEERVYASLAAGKELISARNTKDLFIFR